MNGNAPRRIATQRIPSVQYSRRDFYRHVSRHRWKAFSVFLLVVSGSFAVAVLTPKVYQSQCMLYVRLGRENVRLDPTATLGQSPLMTIPISRENEINSAVEILRSRALAEKVVDELGPNTILEPEVDLESGASGEKLARAEASDDPFPSVVQKWRELLVQLGFAQQLSSREQAIIKLRKNFSAEAFKNADLLSLSYRATSPLLAQEVVARYTELYLKEHAGLNRPPNAHRFLEQQTERAREKVQQSEQLLKELKQETELASPKSQMELLVTRQNRIQDDLLATETQVAATNSDVEALGQKLKVLSETQVAAITTGLSNAAADGMRQLLYNLQLQEKKLDAQYTAEHPELKSIREQIEQSKAVLSQEQETRRTVTEGPSRAYEEIHLAHLRQEALLLSLKAKSDTLRNQFAEAQSQMQLQLENQLQIAALERDVQLQDARYRKYAENLEQANIDQALETERISNINVIQPASFSEKPISPNVLLNLAAGLVAGLIAGIGLTHLCDAFDHSLKTPEEIEDKLDLPLLVTIPRLPRRELLLNGRNGV